MKRFIVREASLFDFEGLRKFYQDNRDQHVMLRSDEAVRNAIDNGVFFIALDTERPDNDRIFAASAVYDVESKDKDGQPILLKEAGGSLVNAEYRGFSVHKIFHCARALHEHILDRGGFSAYFGAIICPNPPSVANIIKAGFERWPMPPAQLVKERAPFAGDGQEIQFYRYKEESLASAAGSLLAYGNKGHLSRQENGDIETCPLVFDLQLFRLYRSLLAELAKGNLDILK